MTLDGMINKYEWMQEELENKKAELEDLKQQIINKMTEQGVDKFQSTEGNIATLSIMMKLQWLHGLKKMDLLI